MNDKTSNELLPCPFCGGEMQIIHIQPLSPLLTNEYHFACKNMCITSRKSYKTEMETIKACNTRKPVERILEKLDERIEHHVRLVNYEMNMGTIVDVERNEAAIIATDKAIEIVKEEGGIE